MDFCRIRTKRTKTGTEVYPEFLVRKSEDLMVRGKDFYAIWDKEKGLWSINAYDVQRLIDEELYRKKKELESLGDEDLGAISVKALEPYSSGSWAEFQSYVTKLPENAHQLDVKLAFSNTDIQKQSYASKKLSYPLEEGDYSAWNDIVGVLYEPSERAKIEWAIGSVISGDSRDIQKFLVFYGEAGSGKSTILNIVQWLFDGYYTTFDAKALTSNGNDFATEVFRSGPLVAIQHDGDLSRIEDNTKLNSIVSHEEMIVNEKYKSQYTARANCLLMVGTNKPVKITDAKSGVIRRLIDVHPSNKKIPAKKYFALMEQVKFQLGGIAWHCLQVYKGMGKNYYDSYRPVDMMFKTDVFFNFVEYNFDEFESQERISLKRAYAIYDDFCKNGGSDFKMPMYRFREELKNYFREFHDVMRVDGKQVRSVFEGFLTEKFDRSGNDIASEEKTEEFLPCFLERESLLDDVLKDSPAQYATDTGVPKKAWSKVNTVLKDIDTKALHYVKPPEKMIVIDFDLKNEMGEKDETANLEAVSKWPPTYGEMSKGGQGIHLHYWYEGDISELSYLWGENIEIKTFGGGSALRRKLSRCNDIPIATLKDGALPKKEKKKMLGTHESKDEEHLRNKIQKALRREVFPNTKPSIDYIYMVLEEAFKSGISYNLDGDLRRDAIHFAMESTNHKLECLKKIETAPWKSEDQLVSVDPKDISEESFVFFDCEVFPNLLLINWKQAGKDRGCVRMINPSPEEVGKLFDFPLIGFNCRRYDNHILYARYLGWSLGEIYDLSKRIVSGDKTAFFGKAYNLSYTDVFDFSSKKQSLKKFEIELGMHHQELGLKWDEPVAEELWGKVAEYCDNDVFATEATFYARSADWTARKILADLTGLSVNDTTNSLTTALIFGADRKPQGEFQYRNLGEMNEDDISPDGFDSFTRFGKKGAIFPGYSFEMGKSLYRGEEIGEGGYVYAEPGVYGNVALLDIASMHPTSIIQEKLFGEKYTKQFEALVTTRILIKHKEFEAAGKMFGGKLKKYLEDEGKAKALAGALKIAINSVYGLTSASFENPFRDPRNKDNIVAKRGALFMVNLKHEVQKRGFRVAHIKTDSIKIPDATPEIIQFVMDYGEMYGYHFEHEATYDKLCLVNDAVYICREKGEKGWIWSATGKEFQVPYVFKSLFSHEPLEFLDKCETREVKSALYLLDKEGNPEFIGKVGLFCPMKEGYGKRLMREQNDKFYAVTGTIGYEWAEAEQVKNSNLEDKIDEGYYRKLCDEAVDHIRKFGDFEWLVDEAQYEMPIPEE